MKYSKNNVKSAFVWSAINSIGNKAISLLLMVALAKLLGPSEYGLIAMLTVFIAVANVFIDSGLNSALIRKLNRNEKDYSTVFIFSLAVAVFLYILLYLSSPLIASFYDQIELISLTRVISLTIIINVFATIPRTILCIKLDFKKQAKSNLIGLVISGFFALILANKGFGAWALVSQQLILVTVNVVLLNIFSPWRPTEKFCRYSFEELFGFSYKLLLSGLIDTIYDNSYALIIGKSYNATQLGVFNQAKMLSMLPATTIIGVIQQVTYPIFSAENSDKNSFHSIYMKTLKLTIMIVTPVMFGLCIVAQPLVNLALGPEWKDVAPLISILTIAYVFYPISAINLNLIKVLGRSDIFLKLEIIKKINITIMLLITVPMGIAEISIGIVITSFLAMLLNTYYTSQYSSVTQLEQLMAAIPILLITLCSSMIGFISGKHIESDIFSIIVTLTVALLVYISLMILIQKKLITEMIILVRENNDCVK